MPDVDRTKLEAGPANVLFDGISLGYLGEALSLNIDTSVVELKGAQAGDTPLDAIVSGGKIMIEVPLAEISVTKFAKGIVNSTLSGLPATGLLTSSGVNLTAADTVTIGTKTYTFRATALTSPTTEGEVLIGATAAASLQNLVNAINRSGGVLGVDYYVAAAHPSVSAVLASPTTIVTTRYATTAAIATTKVAVTLTWTAATMAANVGTGLLTFNNQVGLSLRSLAKELRIIKVKGTTPSTDPNDIFIFPEASPGPSTVKVPFHPTQQRLVVISFYVWPNDVTKAWGTVGAAA